MFSGYGREIQSLSWEIADRRTFVPWAEKKYDVMMFGMPQFFHYGNGHGTNPILILQAIATNVIRHWRVMSDRSVVICSPLSLTAILTIRSSQPTGSYTSFIRAITTTSSRMWRSKS